MPFRKIRTIKPPLGVGIDFSNPLSRQLRHVFAINEGAGNRFNDLIHPDNPALFDTSMRYCYWQGGKFVMPQDWYSGAQGVYRTPDPTNFTISVKVTFTDLSNNWKVAGWYAWSTTWNGIGLVSGNITARVHDGYTESTVTGPAAVVGREYTLTQTYYVSGVTSGHKLYVDGVLVGSANSNNGGGIYVNGHPFGIGGESGYYISQGEILNTCYVWDRVLTAAEVQKIAVNPYQIFQPATDIRSLISISSGSQTIVSNGIATEEVCGTPSVAPQSVSIAPNGIATEEAIGSPTVTRSNETQTVTANGFTETEASGLPTVDLLSDYIKVSGNSIINGTLDDTKSSRYIFSDSPSSADYSICVDLAHSGTPDATASITLISRFIDKDNFYSVFAYATSGEFYIYRRFNGIERELLSDTVSANITSLEFRVIGSVLTAIANNKAISITDTSLGNIGKFGLELNRTNNTLGTITLDNYAVKTWSQSNIFTVACNGIATEEAIGSPTVSPQPVTVVSDGIATEEAMGTPLVYGTQFITTTGIATEEVVGTPSVSIGSTYITANGIATEEAIGSPAVAPQPVTAVANGIATEEVIGQPTTLPQAVTIATNGIATEEAIGTPSVAIGVSYILANGIATSEAIGSPNVTPQAVTVNANGIVSEEAIGQPIVVPPAQNVSANGIATGEALGIPSVAVGGVNVSALGIATQEALGQPTVVPPTATLNANGIASTEAEGQPTVTTGSVALTANGIPSEETVGQPTVAIGVSYILANGIATSEAVGQPSVTVGAVNVAANGIASSEVVGTPTTLPQPVTIGATGIAPEDGVGTPSVGTFNVIATNGIASTEALGQPVVLPQSVSIGTIGIASEEVIGDATVRPMAVVINPSGIATLEYIGQPRVILRVFGYGDISFPDGVPVIYFDTDIPSKPFDSSGIVKKFDTAPKERILT